jgi:hypothetical protein
MAGPLRQPSLRNAMIRTKLWKAIRCVVTVTLGIAICAIGFLALDYATTRFNLHDDETVYRIRDPKLHHTFAPMYSTQRAHWGGAFYELRTNSLGFKDATTRIVDRVPTRHRVVVLGDSFTEGLGLAWEETFVGRFAALNPDIEVLNAAVGSYSPLLYLEKTKWILDQGYRFDEVIVYIDISDIADDGMVYERTPDGSIKGQGADLCPYNYVAEIDAGRHPIPLFAMVKRKLAPALPVTYSIYRMVSAGSFKPRLEAYRPGFLRGMWTIRPDLPCYGAGGVAGAIAKATANMDALAALLRARGIALSVGVYPWPEQLAYDSEESVQVRLWREWCGKAGCKKFFNHFPDLFAHARAAHGWSDMFIEGDIHFNALGSRLIAERLNLEYR